MKEENTNNKGKKASLTEADLKAEINRRIDAKMQSSKKKVENSTKEENSSSEQKKVESSTKEENSSSEQKKESLAIEEELKDAKDKFIRLAAEFENYKKRQLQQSILKEKYSNESFAKSIFPIVDSLEMALEHIEKKEEKNFDEFIRGIHLVHQQFIDVFKKHHIEKVGSREDIFDPTKHEAVSTIETSELEENRIVTVFKAGYSLHDRIIRPAMVQVAKPRKKDTTG